MDDPIKALEAIVIVAHDRGHSVEVVYLPQAKHAQWLVSVRKSSGLLADMGLGRDLAEAVAMLARRY